MNAQDLYLNLIEAAGSWNAFDGPSIASSLRANREVWSAAILCNRGYHLKFNSEGEVTAIQNDYDVLRGLPENTLFLDIIRITPRPGKEAQLEALAESWSADTVEWLVFAEASSAFQYREEAAFSAAGFDPGKAVLELWWD